jgi:uncharacterized protein YajQ (UPF0234 family)
MPSFDVVSKTDLPEVQNAMDQTNREAGARYDFKGSSAKIERKDSVLTLWADSEFQLEQLTDILHQKLAKRGIDLRALDPGKVETISGDKVKQVITVKQGIPQVLAKDVVKRLKESGLKVQGSIQGDAVRVAGKKKDDLQAAIALLRSADLDQPLQYENFRD